VSELIEQEQEQYGPASVIRQEANPLAGTPAFMLQSAIERNASPDMIERLVAIYDQWEAKESRKSYIGAMARFQVNAPQVLKDKHVHFTNRAGTVTEYWHARLSNITKAIGPIAGPLGLSYDWNIQDSVNPIVVTCIVSHISGHEKQVSMSGPPDESGGKNTIQAKKSTVSYLQRTTLLAAFGLAEEDQDDDGRGSEPAQNITIEQAAEIKRLLQETDSDVKRFLGVFGIQTVDTMPAVHYQRAINMLNKKKEKANADSANATK